MKEKRKFHKRRVTEKVSESRDFFTQRFDPDSTRDRGLWCGNCRKRIPWKELDTEYAFSKATQSTYRVWFCGRCGDQLREDDMTDLGMVYELGLGP